MGAPHRLEYVRRIQLRHLLRDITLSDENSIPASDDTLARINTRLEQSNKLNGAISIELQGIRMALEYLARVEYLKLPVTHDWSDYEPDKYLMQDK